MKGQITLIVLLLLQTRILTYYSYSENITVTNYRVGETSEYLKIPQNLSSLQVLNQTTVKGYFRYVYSLEAKKMEIGVLLRLKFPESPSHYSITKNYVFTMPFTPNSTYLNKSLSYSTNNIDLNFKTQSLKEEHFVFDGVKNRPQSTPKTHKAILNVKITPYLRTYREYDLVSFAPKFQNFELFLHLSNTIKKIRFNKEDIDPKKFSSGDYHQEFSGDAKWLYGLVDFVLQFGFLILYCKLKLDSSNDTNQFDFTFGLLFSEFVKTLFFTILALRCSKTKIYLNGIFMICVIRLLILLLFCLNSLDCILNYRVPRRHIALILLASLVWFLACLNYPGLIFKSVFYSIFLFFLDL